MLRNLLKIGVLVFVFNTNLSGQSTDVNTTGNFSQQDLQMLANLNPVGVGVRGFDNRYEGIKGSPLLYEGWQKGKFVIKEKNGFSQEVGINLELVENLLYFRISDRASGSVPSYKIQEIIILHPETAAEMRFKVFESNDFPGLDKNKNVFMQVLKEGDITFLKYIRKQFIQADYEGAYSADRRYDEYKEVSSYFIRFNNKAPEKIKLRKKPIIKALGNKGSKAERLIKKHRLSLETEAGIVRLLELLESE